MPQSQQSVPITMVAVCGAQIAPPYDDERVCPLASAQLPLLVVVDVDVLVVLEGAVAVEDDVVDVAVLGADVVLEVLGVDVEAVQAT